MVNPGSFLGSRKEFLAAQIDLYAAAVTENHVADTVADIQRRYFKRYPVSLAHNEEPSAEWLAQVDDNAADDELMPPDEAKLDSEAFKVAKAAYDEQVKVLKFRKEQIARRLAYQYSKAHNPPKCIEVGSDDPMAVLMAKLAGIPIKKPRLRPACTVWGQHHRQFVDAIFEERVKDKKVPVAQRAALRMRIYKECFGELEEDERKEYEKQAAEEHRKAVEKIENALNAPASTDPADRQQILRGLPGFIQPVLDLVTEYTGWKATLMVGGPEPADQGRLNVMSFHSGETSGGVKMNFGRAERRGYKEYVAPIFGSFLKKCYTIEDCRAAALPDPAAASLADVLRMDGGEFSVDRADVPISYVKVARTPSGGPPSTPSTPALPATYEIPAKVGPPIHAKRLPFQPEGSPSARAANTRSLTADKSSQSVPAVALDATPPVPRSGSDPSQLSLTPPNASRSQSAPPSPCPSPVATPHASPMLNAQELPPEATSTTPRSCPSPSQDEAMLASRDPSPLPASRISSPPACALVPPGVDSAAQVQNALGAGTTLSSGAASPVDSRKRRHADQGRLEKSKAPKTSDDAASGGRRLRSAAIARDPQQRVESESLPPSAPSLPPSAPDSQPTMPLTPEELAGAPDWFLNAYQMLVSKDFGPSWALLVRAWARFEQAEGFSEVEKLGSKGRPVCVRDWIARARSSSYRPDLGALAPFAKAFNAWWRSIQPDWRTEGAGKLLQHRTGDLESLRRPGKNGLLSVLAALFFWAVNASRGSEGGGVRSQAWKAAVDDVHWVIQSLIAN